MIYFVSIPEINKKQAINKSNMIKEMLVLSNSELELVSGGEGVIFDAGAQMVANGEQLMSTGGTIGATYGLAQTALGGWGMIVGGVADWL